MFKHLTCFVFAALTMVCLAGPASAKKGSGTANVDQRQSQQDTRIQQGVSSGQLTTKEASQLNNAQDRIEKRETKLKSDGEFSTKDRSKINHQLDTQNRKIYKQKHDKQKAN